MFIRNMAANMEYHNGEYAGGSVARVALAAGGREKLDLGGCFLFVYHGLKFRSHRMPCCDDFLD